MDVAFTPNIYKNPCMVWLHLINTYAIMLISLKSIFGEKRIQNWKEFKKEFCIKDFCDNKYLVPDKHKCVTELSNINDTKLFCLAESRNISKPNWSSQLL